MSPAVKCLILLAVVALLFVTELIPLAVTAMGGAIACGLLELREKACNTAFCKGLSGFIA